MSKTFRIGAVEVPINTEKCTHVPDELVYILDEKQKGFSEIVLEAVNQSEPVLLVGPTGCGKTATLRYLASKTRNGYRRMQLNGATSLDNFVGRNLINEQGTYWQDGILTTAMREGHWLVLDELNMALPEICAVLNAVMDDDRQRDEAEADIRLKAAELAGKYGTQIDIAEINALMERDRETIRQIAKTQSQGLFNDDFNFSN